MSSSRDPHVPTLFSNLVFRSSFVEAFEGLTLYQSLHNLRQAIGTTETDDEDRETPANASLLNADGLDDLDEVERTFDDSGVESLTLKMPAMSSTYLTADKHDFDSPSHSAATGLSDTHVPDEPKPARATVVSSHAFHHPDVPTCSTEQDIGRLMDLLRRTEFNEEELRDIIVILTERHFHSTAWMQAGIVSDSRTIELQKRIQERDTQFIHDQTIITEINRKLEEIETILTLERCKNSELENSLKNTLRSKEKELEKVLQENSKLKKRNSELEYVRKKHLAEVENLQSQLTCSRQEVMHLNGRLKECEALEMNTGIEMERKQQLLVSQVAERDEAIERLKTQCNNQEEEMIQLKEELALERIDYEDRIKEMQSILERERNKALTETARVGTTESSVDCGHLKEIAELKEELSRLKKGNRSLCDELESANRIKIESLARITTMGETITEKDQQITKLQDSLAALETSSATTSAAPEIIDARRAEQSEGFADSVGQLQVAAAEKDEKITKLSERVCDLEARLRAEEADKALISSLRDEIAKAKEQYNDELAQQQRLAVCAITDKDNQLEALQKCNEDCISQVGSLQEHLDNARSMVRDKDEQLVALEDKHNTTSDELIEQQNHVSILKREITTLRESLSSSELRLESYQVESEQHKEEIELKTRELEAKLKQTEQQNADILSLKQEVNSLKEQIEADTLVLEARERALRHSGEREKSLSLQLSEATDRPTRAIEQLQRAEADPILSHLDYATASLREAGRRIGISDDKEEPTVSVSVAKDDQVHELRMQSEFSVPLNTGQADEGTAAQGAGVSEQSSEQPPGKLQELEARNQQLEQQCSLLRREVACLTEEVERRQQAYNQLSLQSIVAQMSDENADFITETTNGSAPTDTAVINAGTSDDPAAIVGHQRTVCLEAEVVRLKSANKQLFDDLETANRAKLESMNRIEVVSQALREKETSLSQFSDQIKSLEADIAGLTEDAGRIDVLNEKICLLNSEISDRDCRISELVARNDELQVNNIEELSHYQRDLETWRHDKDQSQKDLDELMSLSQQQDEDHKNIVKKLEEELRWANEEVTLSRSSEQTSKEELHNAVTLQKKKDKELDVLKAELSEVLKVKVELTEMINHTSGQLSKAETIIKSLESDLEKSLHTTKCAEAEAANLRLEVARLGGLVVERDKPREHDRDLSEGESTLPSIASSTAPIIMPHSENATGYGESEDGIPVAINWFEPYGEVVLISGTFWDWSAQRELHREHDSLCSVHMKLLPGRYEFKFLVDGRWTTSAAYPTSGTEFGSGVENNYIIVEPVDAKSNELEASQEKADNQMTSLRSTVAEGGTAAHSMVVKSKESATEGVEQPKHQLVVSGTATAQNGTVQEVVNAVVVDAAQQNGILGADDVSVAKEKTISLLNEKLLCAESEIRRLKELQNSVGGDSSKEIDLIRAKNTVLESDLKKYQFIYAEMVFGLTKEQTESYKQAFDNFDKDGTGRITKAEIKSAIKACGLKASDKWVQELMAEADADGSGTIEWAEYLKAMTGMTAESRKESQQSAPVVESAVDGRDESLKELKDHLAAANSEIVKLRFELQEHENAITARKAEDDARATSAGSSSEELDKLKACVQELTTELTARNNQIERLKADLQGQHGAVAQVEESVKNLTNFNMTLKTELTDYKISYAKAVHGLTDQEVSRYKASFDAFDRDGSGHITRGEIAHALKACGYDATDELVQKLLDKADTDGSGTIEWSEFLNSTAARNQEMKSSARQHQEQQSEAVHVESHKDAGLILQIQELNEKLKAKDAEIEHIKSRAASRDSETTTKYQHDLDEHRKLTQQLVASAFPTLQLPPKTGTYREWLLKLKEIIQQEVAQGHTATHHHDPTLTPDIPTGSAELTRRLLHYESILAQTDSLLTALEGSAIDTEKKYAEKCKEYEEAIHELKAENSSLASKLQTVGKTKKSDSESEEVELAKSVDELQAQYSLLRSEIDKLRREKEELLYRPSAPGGDNTGQLNVMRMRLELIEKEKTTLEKEVHTMARELDSERRTGRDLSVQSVKLRGMLKTGQDALRNEQDHIFRLQSQLREIKSGAKENGLEQLKDKLADTQKLLENEIMINRQLNNKLTSLGVSLKTESTG